MCCTARILKTVDIVSTRSYDRYIPIRQAPLRNEVNIRMATQKKKRGVVSRIFEEEHAALTAIKNEHRLSSLSAAIDFILKENAALKAQAKK